MKTKGSFRFCLVLTLAIAPVFGQRMIDDLKIGMTVKQAEATLGRSLGAEKESGHFKSLRDLCGQNWTMDLIFKGGTLWGVNLYSPSPRNARDSQADLNCVQANLETKYGTGRMRQLSQNGESGELVWQKDGVEIHLDFMIYKLSNTGLLTVHYGKPWEKGL